TASALEDECHHHVDLILDDLPALDAYLLLLDPGALDVTQRLVGTGESLSDRVLEARGRCGADLRYLCDGHAYLRGWNPLEPADEFIGGTRSEANCGPRSARKVAPEQIRCRVQRHRIPLHACDPGCVGRVVVRRSRHTACTRELVQLRRSDSPVTALLSRHDVIVIMRHFLSAVNVVVLVREYRERLVGVQHRVRDRSRRLHYCRALRISEIT